MCGKAEKSAKQVEHMHVYAFAHASGAHTHTHIYIYIDIDIYRYIHTHSLPSALTVAWNDAVPIQGLRRRTWLGDMAWEEHFECACSIMLGICVCHNPVKHKASAPMYTFHAHHPHKHLFHPQLLHTDTTHLPAEPMIYPSALEIPIHHPHFPKHFTPRPLSWLRPQPFITPFIPACIPTY